MPQWGRFSLFWRKWIQFIEKLKCWSVFPLWIKKWHLLCHSNYCKKVLVNKKYWSPSRKHVLVYPRNKIDWSSECYNIKCPRTQMLQLRVGKGKPQKLPREGNLWDVNRRSFEYKETMIHKIFVYNILWMKLVNKKKRFFFLSDLWQDHLINDFVEKLIEIKTHDNTS